MRACVALLAVVGVGLSACAQPECGPVDELPVEWRQEASEARLGLGEEVAARLLEAIVDRPFCARGVVVDAQAEPQDPGGVPVTLAGPDEPIVLAHDSVNDDWLAHGACHALLGPDGWPASDEERFLVRDEPLPECPGCDGDWDQRYTEGWAEACAYYLAEVPPNLQQHWDRLCPGQALDDPWLPLVAPWLPGTERSDPPLLRTDITSLQWQAVSLDYDVRPYTAQTVEWRGALAFLDYDYDADTTWLGVSDWSDGSAGLLPLPEGRWSWRWGLLDGDPGPVVVDATMGEERLYRLDAAWRLEEDATWTAIDFPDLEYDNLAGFVDGDQWTVLATGGLGLDYDELALAEWSPGEREPRLVALGEDQGFGKPSLWRHDGQLWAAFQHCAAPGLCVPRVLQRSEQGWAVVRSAPLLWRPRSFLPTLEGGLLIGVADQNIYDEHMIFASTPEQPAWTLQQIDCTRSGSVDLPFYSVRSDVLGSWALSFSQHDWRRAAL